MGSIRFGANFAASSVVNNMIEYYGKNHIQVLDYDGSVIQETYLDTGDEFALPAGPVHENLTFQGWSSPIQIVNNKITVGRGDMAIGAVYTTKSGQNEFDIELTSVSGLTVTFKMNGTKDWGDGTTDTSTSHTYSKVGKYTIKCNGTQFTNISSSSGVFGQSQPSQNYTLKAIRLATVQTIPAYSFIQCFSTEYMTLSNTVTMIGQYCFQMNVSLKSIIIPSNVTTIGDYALGYNMSTPTVVLPYGLTHLGEQQFLYCTGLKYMYEPDTVTTVGAHLHQNAYALESLHVPANLTALNTSYATNCYSLTKLKFPSTVTSVGESSFANDFSIIEYDFSEATQVPTLMTTDVFLGINATTKIKVPANLYDEWISSTNWSNFADYIEAV